MIKYRNIDAYIATTKGVNVNDSVLEQLGQVSTATLQNQLVKRGLRNTVPYRVRPLTVEYTRMIGPATTLRMIPSREDVDVHAIFADPQNAQRVAVDTAAPGSVLVVDSRSDDRAASAGEILLTRLNRRGVAGFVTDGAIRDFPEIEKIGLPVFAQGSTPATNLVAHHPVDIDVPVSCGGVAVYPGDMVVGDRDGLVIIPAHLVEEVAADAVEQERLEAYLLSRVQAGEPVIGTYPPREEVRADYERFRAGEAGTS